MDNRTISRQESLEIISKMISRTRTRVSRDTAVTFLIWGYASIITTFLVWISYTLTHDLRAFYLWYLLPLICFPLTYWNYSKRKSLSDGKGYSKNYTDELVGYIWRIIGITILVLSTFTIFISYLPILFLVAMLLGIATSLTGYIVQAKELELSGIVTLIASSVLLFMKEWSLQMLSFSLLIGIMMIVPGHILRYKYKRMSEGKGGVA
ncbi:hypothetical protein [Porphyromonas pogonae]|uniref:hypothetical protein n=1 Tax=Porphyromonas pogonae TaxID=867595 RepID=UPI002E7A9D47|nr:hypothetical protein [Porphyromonas pogonae]